MPSRPPVLPKQPKGRWFVALSFLAALSLAGYLLYLNCFRFKCSGLIQGRVISLAAPWNGTVNGWEVAEGATVSRGSPLVSLRNLELQHRLESLQGDLILTQAQIESESSRIRLQASEHADRQRMAQAEFLQTQGELLSDTARLEEMTSRLVRMQKLSRTGSVAGQELLQLKAQIEGLDQKTGMLRDSVEILRLRAETGPREPEDAQQALLKPLLAKQKQIESEIRRVQERLLEGTLHSPMRGTVIARHSLSGESVSTNQPLVEILEQDSLEVVLYVPAAFADDLIPDQILEVAVEPGHRLLKCRVTRRENRLVKPPESLGPHVSGNDWLLPIHLKPLPGYGPQLELHVNSVVKLPYAWSEWADDHRQAILNGLKRLWSQAPSPQTSESANAAANGVRIPEGDE